MPIYSYECRCGKKHEVFHKINRVPKKHRCSCGWMAKKVIGSGGIQCDSVNDVKWLPSACKVLQKHGEAPLQSRSEYRKYLRDNHLQCTG
jgi:putative FmdB family regulatory protein